MVVPCKNYQITGPAMFLTIEEHSSSSNNTKKVEYRNLELDSKILMKLFKYHARRMININIRIYVA